MREAAVDAEGTILPDGQFEVLADDPFVAEAFELEELGSDEPIIVFRMNPGEAIDPPFPVTGCPAVRLANRARVELVFVHDLT